MNNNIKVLGYRPSTHLSGDLLFASVKAEFTKLSLSNNNEFVLTEYTPLSNQKNLGSCVANACADALEILQGQKGNITQLSRLFLYWNARVAINETNKDDGCFVRDCMNSMTSLGVCTEDIWEYDTTKVFAQPPLRAYREAYVNKFSSYYSINSSGQDRIDDIELAVRSNHPVVFATLVNTDFTKAFGSTKIWKNADGPAAGYHAIIITGVRDNGPQKEFLIRNSWGDSWGENGHCWFDQSYLTKPYTTDLWVPTQDIQIT